MHLRWLGLSLFVPAIVIACVGDSAIVGNPPDSSVANDARVESGADVAALPDAGWSPATLDAANQPCADLAVGEDTFAPSGQSASRSEQEQEQREQRAGVSAFARLSRRQQT